MPEPKSRRTRDSEAARSAILAAAEDHFARYGYSGARVDAIAEDSGYNKSLIFHYFGDKLGLYRAVVGCVKGDQENQLSALLQRFVAEDAPLTYDAVRDFITLATGFWFDRVDTNPRLRRILLWEAAEEWQTFAMSPSLVGITAMIRAIEHFLQLAQAAGYIRPDIDPITLITNVPLWAMIECASPARHAMFFPDRDFTSPAARAHAREQFVRMVLHSAMPAHPSEQQTDAV
jgi:TetR/AcrR family transcriptional regulator